MQVFGTVYLNTRLHRLYYISLYCIPLHCIYIVVMLGLCYTFWPELPMLPFFIKGMLILLLLPSSAYQVLVLKVVDGAKELPGDYDSKLNDSNNANKENLDFYITAEFQNVPVYQQSWEFTVGDDKMYEGFVNKALEKGEEYVIFQRAVTRDKDVSKLTQFRVIELVYI